MLDSYLVLIVILLILAGVAHFKARVSQGEMVLKGLREALPFLVRLPAALLTGSFVAALIEPRYILQFLGEASGSSGVILASLVGGFMPGGPMVTFPLLLVFNEAGVGMPQMIALLTAWLVLAYHRILAYEWPMLGPGFVWRRLVACVPLPMAAGLLAQLVLNFV